MLAAIKSRFPVTPTDTELLAIMLHPVHGKLTHKYYRKRLQVGELQALKNRGKSLLKQYARNLARLETQPAQVYCQKAVNSGLNSYDDDDDDDSRIENESDIEVLCLSADDMSDADSDAGSDAGSDQEKGTRIHVGNRRDLISNSTTNACNEKADEEVNLYLIKLGKQKDNTLSPAKFWQEFHDQYPLLKKLYICVGCISFATARLEGTFNRARKSISVEKAGKLQEKSTVENLHVKLAIDCNPVPQCVLQDAALLHLNRNKQVGEPTRKRLQGEIENHDKEKAGKAQKQIKIDSVFKAKETKKK